MSPVTGQCVGIDISEEFLDIDLHPEGKEVRPARSDEGTASLVALLREFKVERVVLESTGVYSVIECGLSKRRGTLSPAWGS